MTFWDKISGLFQSMPQKDISFIENSWVVFNKIASQFFADALNAFRSFSPYHIPINNIRYWFYYTPVDGVWNIDDDIYSIPTLQTSLFGDYVIYIEGIDYNIVNSAISWISSPPEEVFARETLMRNSDLDSLALKYGYEGINTNFPPQQSCEVVKLLNQSIRNADIKNDFESGFLAVLGLPFAYKESIIKEKTTVGDNHIITLTGIGDTDNYSVQVATTVCTLDDIKDVNSVVAKHESLLNEPLKFKHIGGYEFERLEGKNLPADGDMESEDCSEWTVVTSGGNINLSKNASEAYAGSKCLKIDSVGDGYIITANASSLSAGDYILDFQIKGSGIIKCDVMGGSTVLASEKFCKPSYENGRLYFSLSATTNITIKYIIIKTGIFYIDNVEFFEKITPLPIIAKKTGADEVTYSLGDMYLKVGDKVSIRNFVGTKEIAVISDINGYVITFEDNLMAIYSSSDYLLLDLAFKNSGYSKGIEVFCFYNADTSNINRFIDKVENPSRPITFISPY